MRYGYITEYREAIYTGRVTVGRWIRLWYDKVVGMLDTRECFYDERKANLAINFIQTFCHHNQGMSGTITLELWQKALVSVVFGCVDKNGNRQFRECLVIVARKNGKTLLASAIACYAAFCDREYGAYVICVAPKLDQAELVYSDIWQTIEKEPELLAMSKRRKSDYYVAISNTTIKKIAFNSKKSDGFNPSLAICDEIASWQGDAGLKQYSVIKSAFGARKQPLLLSISTAGYLSGGVYDDLVARATAVIQGNSKEKRYAPFLYQIDDIARWDDIEEIKKANPNYGVSVNYEHIEEQLNGAYVSLPQKAEVLAKICNIKQNSSQAWLMASDVEEACCDELHLEDFANCYAVVGIDLSRTMDLTSACVIVEKDGILHIFSKFWMPQEQVEKATQRDGVPYNIYIQRGLLEVSGQNTVDYKACSEWVKELYTKYNIYVLRVGYDRYCANYLVGELDNYGFKTDDVFQGYNLTPVIRETEGLIKDGKIKIGNNDLLKIHFLNSAVKIDNETERMKLVKIASNQHIDGMAAVLDAMTVRQKWYSEIGEQLANR